MLCDFAEHGGPCVRLELRAELFCPRLSVACFGQRHTSALRAWVRQVLQHLRRAWLGGKEAQERQLFHHQNEGPLHLVWERNPLALVCQRSIVNSSHQRPALTRLELEKSPSVLGTRLHLEFLEACGEPVLIF